MNTRYWFAFIVIKCSAHVLYSNSYELHTHKHTHTHTRTHARTSDFQEDKIKSRANSKISEKWMGLHMGLFITLSSSMSQAIILERTDLCLHNQTTSHNRWLVIASPHAFEDRLLNMECKRFWQPFNVRVKVYLCFIHHPLQFDMPHDHVRFFVTPITQNSTPG